MSIFTLLFWRAAIERAIKSAAQGALVAGIGAAGFDVLTADFQTIGGLAGGMALASLLTSVASDAITGSGPSLTNAERLDPPPPGPVDEAGESRVALAVIVAIAVVLFLAIVGVVDLGR